MVTSNAEQLLCGSEIVHCGCEMVGHSTTNRANGSEATRFRYPRGRCPDSRRTGWVAGFALAGREEKQKDTRHYCILTNQLPCWSECSSACVFVGVIREYAQELLDLIARRDRV